MFLQQRHRGPQIFLVCLLLNMYPLHIKRHQKQDLLSAFLGHGIVKWHLSSERQLSNIQKRPPSGGKKIILNLFGQRSSMSKSGYRLSPPPASTTQDAGHLHAFSGVVSGATTPCALVSLSPSSFSNILLLESQLHPLWSAARKSGLFL